MVGKTGLVVAAIFFGLTLSTVCPADASGGSHRIETTHGRFSGVITELEETSMTVTQDGTRVPGTLDKTKTRVTIEGRDASLGELRHGYMVKARLGLDDVWENIVVYDR